MNNLVHLGIIAGNNSLPLEFANLYIENGGCVAIANIGDGNFSHLNVPCEHFSIGQVGKILEFFLHHNIKDLLVIGAVERTSLSSIYPDLQGAKLLAKIMQNQLLGDDTILRVVAQFLEQKDFRLLSPHYIINNLQKHQIRIANMGTATERELKDIEIGKNLLKSLSKFDVGQAVIIQDGYVIGIEAAEGTDKLIERCAAIRKGVYGANKSGGILIKTSKDNQDERLDLPTIGPKTIENLIAHKYRGIVVSQEVLIADKKTTNQLIEQGNVLFLTLESDIKK